MKKEVIEGWVDVHGCQFQHVAHTGGGEIETPALIPPQRLVGEADQAQAKSQQGQKRQHKEAILNPPDCTSTDSP